MSTTAIHLWLLNEMEREYREELMRMEGVEGWGGLSEEGVLTPVQTHSVNVAVVKQGDPRPEDTDAVITFSRGLAIGVRTADCVPIILYAPDVEGVAAVHAGWKGTLHGTLDRTIDVLIRHGADPSYMYATFGPSISKNDYEVDNELGEKFKEAGFGEFVIRDPHDPKIKPHLDLQGANRARLLRRGVLPENIIDHPYSTLSRKDSDGAYVYPSYRRDGTSRRFFTCIKLI